MTPLPVTVLTGFLGAGKTTLLNHVLRAEHGRRFAVIVNEFGSVGVDGELLASGGEELIELANGCVCCTVRGDLLRTLHGLAPRLAEFDGVLIETTGLADPGPVAQTFLMDDALRARLRLDGIVTVIDALHVLDQLADHAEAAEQIAFADLLVIAKTDLVRPAGLAAIRARLAAINPAAGIVVAERGVVPPQALFDRGGFDLDRVETLLAAAASRGPLHAHHADDHDHDHGHGDHAHGPDGVVTLTLTADAPLAEDRVIDWLSDYLAGNGRNVLRAKGVLDAAGEDRRLVLQGVHMILEGDYLSPWPAGPRRSRLVLIGRALDGPALRRGFLACTA